MRYDQQEYAQTSLFWQQALAKRCFAITPESHRLVFTRFEDDGVSVTHPSHEALYYMTGPGGYWNGYPFGFLNELVRRKSCPILQRGHACTKEAATRFVKAMQFGGKSCEEAWDIIAQHDCARFGHLIEVQHVDELPPDRWYRDAWYRSANGGPIMVSLDRARLIQLQHIGNVTYEFNRWNERNLKPTIAHDADAIQRAIDDAPDLETLRQVWPDNLPRVRAQ